MAIQRTFENFVVYNMTHYTNKMTIKLTFEKLVNMRNVKFTGFDDAEVEF